MEIKLMEEGSIWDEIVWPKVTHRQNGKGAGLDWIKQNICNILPFLTLPHPHNQFLPLSTFSHPKAGKLTRSVPKKTSFDLSLWMSLTDEFLPPTCESEAFQ